MTQRRQSRILPVILILFFGLIQTTLAACPTIFYAKQINFTDTQDLSFYKTQMSIQSSAECANFCSNKTFCRTAVYNHMAKTCAMSYDTKIGCRKESKRYNSYFFESSSSDPLTIIACIDRCKYGELHSPIDISSFAHEKSGENIDKSEKSNFNPKFSAHFSTPSHEESNNNNGADKLFTSSSDETTSFTPEPVVITEADLKNSNTKKTVKMIPQPLGFETVETKEASAASDNGKIIGEIIKKQENFVIQKKNGGGLFTTTKNKSKLVTISPEEFEKVIGSEALLKTINATGKIEVTANDIDKIIEAVKKHIESNQENLNKKNSNKNEKKGTETKSANDKTEIQKTSNSQEILSTTPSTTKLAYTTTTEPIVINGKVLSPDAARNLMEFERTSTTTTTTPRPILLTTEEGFMNTFVFTGVHDMFREALAERFKQGQGHLSPELSTDPTSADGTVCYRILSQQVLYHASYETLPGRVSINECRCACAKTWEIEATKPKCKSLQFNELTGECNLNRDDHTGKYDLVFDKNFDYHYISCELGVLLDTKEKKCGGENSKNGEVDLNRIDLDGENSKSSSAIPLSSTATNTQKIPSTSPTSKASTNAPTTQPSLYKGDESQIVKDELPTPILTVAEMDGHKYKLSSIKPKKMEVNITEKVDIMFSTTTTAIPGSLITAPEIEVEKLPIEAAAATEPSVERTTVKEKPMLKTAAPNLITEGSSLETATEAAKKAKVEIPESEEDEAENEITTKSSNLSGLKPEKVTTTSEIISSSGTSTTEAPETTRPPTTTTTTVTEPLSPTTTIKTASTSDHRKGPSKPSNKNIKKYKIEKCFETFNGYKLMSMPGGLESEVTLEECQCFCANSKSSKRYGFQCLSALYFHKERDCMLYLDNRQLKPEAFSKAPETDGNVTYIGMICPLSKTIETHVNPNYDFGCMNPEPSTTPVIRTTTTAVHTDECFNEHPKYVLEGTSLAVVSNVSVEECKCYCIDSDARYGSDCQSIQYYYDSQTCLLNKENQITDPENFVYDPNGEQMRSYFDYTCRSERIILSVYVEQICHSIVEVNLKNIGLADIRPPGIMPDDNDNSLPNNDDQSEEVKKETEDSSEKDTENPTTSTSTTTTTVTTTTTTTPIPTTTTTTTTTPKPTTTTQKITKPPTTTFKPTPTKKSRIAEFEELSSESTEEGDDADTPSPTTPIPTTTTTGEYQQKAKCTYSALYQTYFNGDRMIDKISVTNPEQCLDACYAARCRSANLVHMSGVLKDCELYKDSIIDFRRTDVIAFDAAAVHFGSIQCKEI